MDPTTTLWIVSILAALGFTAAGYFLARMRAEETTTQAKAIPAPAPMPEPATPAKVEEPALAKSEPSAPAKSEPPPVDTPADADELALDEPVPPERITLPQFSDDLLKPPERLVAAKPMPITVPPASPNDAKTKPPPPLEYESAELAAARKRDERLDPDGGEPHLVDQDLSALERDLRTEMAARREAEKRAADLMSRLVSSSQQITALRAKLGMADDLVRRPTSMPPVATRTSERPERPGSGGYGRLQALAPGLFSEIEDLRREVDRLRLENETLRLSAFTKQK